MALTTLALVLVAAAIHAFWNLVIAGARDTQATTAVGIAAAVALFLPIALLRWDVQPQAWPAIIASALLETAYFWLLTTAYGRAEMTLVYPIARGMAPVIVLLVSALILGVQTGPAQALGVGLVGSGVLLVRGVRGGARWSDVGLALVVAGVIAGYTLVDKQGVRYADPLTYITLVLVIPAIASIAFVMARGGFARLRRAQLKLALAGGVASLIAYALILLALTTTAAAPVAAVREVGVVFAAVLGAVFLHERVGVGRLIGSIVVVIGIALVVSG